MTQKILFSNIGYAKGIDGTLWQHLSRAGRYLYCRVPTQTLVLGQLKAIIDLEQPDLCCFVEIDSGSLHSAYVNQLKLLNRIGCHGRTGPLSLPRRPGSAAADRRRSGLSVVPAGGAVGAILAAG